MSKPPIIRGRQSVIRKIYYSPTSMAKFNPKGRKPTRIPRLLPSFWLELAARKGITHHAPARPARRHQSINHNGLKRRTDAQPLRERTRLFAGLSSTNAEKSKIMESVSEATSTLYDHSVMSVGCCFCGSSHCYMYAIYMADGSCTGNSFWIRIGNGVIPHAFRKTLF